MLSQITKNRILFFVAIAIGSIGATGQAYMLHHELVNCYPYKMMDWQFYKSIANFGIYFAPTVATIVGLLLSLKRFWLATIVPVILCPLLFSVVFKICSILRVGGDATWHFDGKTPAMAGQDFFLYTITLSVIGLFIGSICSFVLSRFLVSNKLP